MNSKFFDLKKEKQDRMINAALKVFAQNGYKSASTDVIVQAAGISKGLLFHYFTNKIGLYKFVYDYSAKYMMLQLSTCVDKKETNFFEVHKQVEQAKVQVLKNYPYMQRFLEQTVYEDVSEALFAIEEKSGQLEETYASVYKQIDTSSIRADVDIKQLMKVIRFTISGLMEECFREDYFQPDMFYKEVLQYLDMLKKLTEK